MAFSSILRQEEYYSGLQETTVAYGGLQQHTVTITTLQWPTGDYSSLRWPAAAYSDLQRPEEACNTRSSGITLKIYLTVSLIKSMHIRLSSTSAVSLPALQATTTTIIPRT